MYNVNFLPVNELFQCNITLITAADIPPENRYIDDKSRKKLLSYEEVINSLGIMSTKAQGLKKPITTVEKLRKFPDQKLYILKDSQANSGSGQAIGLLKVGPKSLFIYNNENKLYNATPMCVLDFFVLEGKQRAGNGKKLFDYMLQDVNLKPYELAIDGPSTKMLSFLRKHYDFKGVVKQSNNFAVCERFFESMSHKCQESQFEGDQNSRPAYHRWHSEVASIIHGGSSSSSTMSRHSESSSPLSEADLETSEERYEAAKTTRRDSPQPSEVSPRTTSKAPERPSTLSFECSNVLEPEAGVVHSEHSTSEHSDSHLTEQGYVDLKFHHKKLW